MLVMDFETQGINFKDANLQASLFEFDDLTGAIFIDASLSSATLLFDTLNGVNFDHTQLVGTQMAGSMDAISMDGTHVAAANVDLDRIQASRVAVFSDENDLFSAEGDQEYAEWKKLILEDKPEHSLFPALSESFLKVERLDNLVASRYPAYDETFKWSDLNERFGFKDPGGGADDKRTTTYLTEVVEIACRSSGKPYVARNSLGFKKPLYFKDWLERLSNMFTVKFPSLTPLVEKKRGDPNSCPGMKEIFEAWPITYTSQTTSH